MVDQAICVPECQNQLEIRLGTSTDIKSNQCRGVTGNIDQGFLVGSQSSLTQPQNSAVALVSNDRDS